MRLPALFADADRAAAGAQREYLAFVGAEYVLLIAAAWLGLVASDSVGLLIFFELCFLGSLVLMLVRTFKKPERDWYLCRALAESIRTASWRYAMCAHPFDREQADSRAALRQLLKETIEANKSIGHRITGAATSGEQISEAMTAIRAAPLGERLGIYVAERVRDQREWYKRKTGQNRRWMGWWIGICVIIYVLAAIGALYRLKHPHVDPEPLIVMASSVLGWMQAKKYAELASSYALTAHEIGLIQERAEEVDSEPTLSEFVNEAEMAFSREHTQWTARQHQA